MSNLVACKRHISSAINLKCNAPFFGSQSKKCNSNLTASGTFHRQSLTNASKFLYKLITNASVKNKTLDVYYLLANVIVKFKIFQDNLTSFWRQNKVY